MTSTQSALDGTAVPQGSQDRTHALFAALGDLIVVVDDVGHVQEMVSGRSRSTFADWNGALPWERDATCTIGQALFGHDTHEAIQYDLNYAQLVEDFLPRQVVLSQMAREVRRAGRVFELDLIPLDDRPTFEALVRLVDVTDALEERQRAKGDREFRSVMEKLMSNIEASRGFFGETRWLLDQLVDGVEAGKLARDLHTLKGNLGCFGFDSLGNEVHRIEDLLIASDLAGTWTGIQTLKEAWGRHERTFGTMFASRADKEVVVSREEYEEMVMLCMVQADYTELLTEVQRWAMDPISQVFERLTVQIERVAGHLGKRVEIVSEPNNVRLPATGLQSFWSSLVHLVRNAVDHGIELPADRVAAGKPETGRITMRAELDDDTVSIHFVDDGAGIDWDRVKAKAQAQGLPHESHDELVLALMAPGLSTRDDADTVSGRGIGTSAVVEAVEALGGRVGIESARGQGTTVSLQVPLAKLATLGLIS